MGCVTLTEVTNLSELQFPHLYLDGNNISYLPEFLVNKVDHIQNSLPYASCYSREEDSVSSNYYLL